jgi:hypothetical protein
MTIQAPEFWDEDGPQELVVDTTVPISGNPLMEGLRDLEQACDQVAAGRDQATYDAMIANGQEDALHALDHARRNARALLADGATKRQDGPDHSPGMTRSNPASPPQQMSTKGRES